MPLQPPLAVQLVALIEDQLRVLVCPEAMLAGLAPKVIVGGAGVAPTVTVADWLVVPPVPVQVSVYVVVLVGDTFWEPLVFWGPLQPPLAVQFAALIADQLRVLSWPEAMVAGLVPKAIEGGAGVVPTVTVADWLVVPPAPVQESV